MVSENGRQDVMGFTHFCDYLLRTKYNEDRQLTGAIGGVAQPRLTPMPYHSFKLCCSRAQYRAVVSSGYQ